MSISMYSASVPIFQRILSNLSHFLDKGQLHAEAKKFDTTVLVSSRLAPDMLPLAAQIRIACDAAKLAVARIGGIDAPKFEDNETTWPELSARIQKTLDFLATVTPAQLDGTDTKEVTFPVSRDGKTRTMSAEDYLNGWAMPNVYFHITMSYAILRHNGVALGKTDYLTGQV
jgi:uncharacterized protein